MGNEASLRSPFLFAASSSASNFHSPDNNAPFHSSGLLRCTTVLRASPTPQRDRQGVVSRRVGVFLFEAHGHLCRGWVLGENRRVLHCTESGQPRAQARPWRQTRRAHTARLRTRWQQERTRYARQQYKGVEIEITVKPIAEYQNDESFELVLPAAPAIMVGEEIVVEGSNIA